MSEIISLVFLLPGAWLVCCQSGVDEGPVILNNSQKAVFITPSPGGGTTPASGPRLSWTADGSRSSPACPAPGGEARPRGTLN